jgi:hypothetical protein
MMDGMCFISGTEISDRFNLDGKCSPPYLSEYFKGEIKAELK